MNRKSTLIGKAQGWPTSTFQPLLTAFDNSVNFLGSWGSISWANLLSGTTSNSLRWKNVVDADPLPRPLFVLSKHLVERCPPDCQSCTVDPRRLPSVDKTCLRTYTTSTQHQYRRVIKRHAREVEWGSLRPRQGRHDTTQWRFARQAETAPSNLPSSSLHMFIGQPAVGLFRPHGGAATRESSPCPERRETSFKSRHGSPQTERCPCGKTAPKTLHRTHRQKTATPVSPKKEIVAPCRATLAAGSGFSLHVLKQHPLPRSV